MKYKSIKHVAEALEKALRNRYEVATSKHYVRYFKSLLIRRR